MPASKRKAIRQAFLDDFKKEDFDGGLKHGIELIGAALKTKTVRGAAIPPSRVRIPRAGVPEQAKGSGMTSIIIIGGVILAVLIGIRLLSGLFGMLRGGGSYGPPPGMRSRHGRRLWRRLWRAGICRRPTGGRRIHVQPLRRHRRRAVRQLSL